MAGVSNDSADDESLRELVDVFQQRIIQHLPEPSRLFPHLDLGLIDMCKPWLHFVILSVLLYLNDM